MPNRSFPVPDCKHVATAKAYLGRSKFSKSTKKKIAACINRKAKQLGCSVSKKAKADVDLLEDLQNFSYAKLKKDEKRLYVSDAFATTRELVEESIKNPGMELFEAEEQAAKETAAIVGSKSLPTNDRSEWDGSAAADRIAKWAGGPDKDDINFSKYARGFVARSGEKDNITSYKLPFADVIGGKLTATWGGVHNAMAAVLGARGGVKGVDKKKAYNFLKSYYKKFDEEVPEYK